MAPGEEPIQSVTRQSSPAADAQHTSDPVDGARGRDRRINRSAPVCDECAAPAIVHISDIVDGSAVMHHYCRQCADDAEVHRFVTGEYSGLAALPIVVGGFLLTLSLFADQLAFGSSEGFGWLQWTGVVLAGIIMLLGAVARAPIFVMIGLIAGILATLADWLAFGSAQGFGWQQILGCAAGALLIATGIAVARIRS